MKTQYNTFIASAQDIIRKNAVTMNRCGREDIRMPVLARNGKLTPIGHTITSISEQCGLELTMNELKGLMLLAYRGDKVPSCINCGNEFLEHEKIQKHHEFCSCKCRATSEKWLSTIQETSMARYGVSNINKLDEVKAKKEATSMLRYGAAYPIQNLEERNRRSERCFKKNGYYNHFQSPDVVSSNNRYKRKTHLGHIGLQGYEPQALDILIDEYDIDPSDIISSAAHLPSSFWYSDNGKKRRYYPDFWLPTRNMIIEVKSKYTWESEMSINILKAESVLLQGHSFRLMIINKNGELI